MVLPLLKLGTLALKTLSKPVAAKLKKEAGKHPKFRSFIISVAQANHRITTTMQRRIYGHATNVKIRPLDEEKAVQAAGDLIGELFVFSVGVGALIFEVQRNARSEAKKEELRKQDIEGLRNEVELLKQEIEMAKARGLAGVFSPRNNHPEEPKQTPVASS
ncbi:optic atrophy 3 protein [Striga asiatica]|uniref:Optic atrophy 3 protein n=1 Tax=Striga asiatica TaxID=4170 RepID=A0A5A7PGE7_STRAF|nr:optic atrophy 3 protein [Striga asiatica]